MLNILFTKTNKLLAWWPTAAQGDMIVEKLDPLFKSGSSLIHENDLYLYIGVYIAATIFFALMYFLVEAFFKLIQF